MPRKANKLLGLAVMAVAIAPASAIIRHWPREDTDCNNNITIYEAEDAMLTGVEAANTEPGYTGSGYVIGFDESTDKITFTVTSSSLQLYDLTITYAGIYGDKYTLMVLNGGASSEVYLPATDTFESVSGGQVLLNEGDNTIELVNHWGWYLIDSIALAPSAPRGAHSITDTLINPNADESAYTLYNYLKSIYGKSILSGQQDLNWAEYVENTVGRAPALLSADLIDYTPSRVERGTVGTSMEEAISYDERGGIISVLWHWNAPTGLYDSEDYPWWWGFYTEGTDFNIATALADTTNANYTLLLRDIDAIAEQLKKLENASVPVLFRPLHEAEGGWFWWGAQGPEPCLKLWDLLQERLMVYHGINNLIWVWNSLAEDWYPGDDKVDILAADVYAEGNGPMSVQYNTLVELGHDTKLIAASEVGAAPLPNLLKAYEAHWLWFCVWGDTFINNEAWNSVADLTTIYTSDYVLTLDEIQGWRDIM